MNVQANHNLETDALIGSLLDGRYLINFLVARGGMGNIYQAHDVRQGRIVALKMLRSEYNDDYQVVQRFLRETKALSHLTHPNICQIFDSGCTAQGLHYFTMEYLEGQPLDSILRKRRTLDPATALRYITQVAAALSDAHNHGIIHRDLKPANIFIVQVNNAPEFVKVLDFGVARLQDSAPDVANKLTSVGATLGTPFYMSPEQIQGSDVDGRTDVYALGIILWECLFGTPPYTGASLIDIFSAAVNQKLPKLPKNLRTSKLWEHIYEILVKALQKNRDRRFASMQDFLRTLESLEHEISGNPAHPLTTTPRSLKAYAPSRMLDTIHHFLRHISPLRLVVVGSIACICIASIIACIVFIFPQEIETPQPHFDTYKFFADERATIQIGEKIIGTTPTSVDLDEKPPFAIIFKTKDKTYSFTVSDRPTEISGFAVNLKSGNADDPRLVLNTNPPGATIELDRKPYPIKTPCRIDIADRQRLTLRLSKDGYRPETILVIPNGRTMTIHTNLFR